MSNQRSIKKKMMLFSGIELLKSVKNKSKKKSGTHLESAIKDYKFKV